MLNTYNNNCLAWTKQDLEKTCPAIFTDHQNPSTTGEDYGFISSKDVLRFFEDLGWKVYGASQRQLDLTREDLENPEKVKARHDLALYGRHCVKLRHPTNPGFKPSKVGDLWPEIVFTNSHNGSSPFTLDIGLFRLVCTNGMVSSNQETIKVKHQGFKMLDVSHAIDDMTESMGSVWNTVDKMIGATMSQQQKLDFADSALDLKGQDIANQIDPAALLQVRRPEDHNDNLFTVLNVVQENLIRGGIPMTKNRQGKRNARTRPVTSIMEDIRINRDLWDQTMLTLDVEFA